MGHSGHMTKDANRDYKSLKFRVSDEIDAQIRAAYSAAKKENSLSGYSLSDFLRHLVEVGLKHSTLLRKKD